MHIKVDERWDRLCSGLLRWGGTQVEVRMNCPIQLASMKSTILHTKRFRQIDLKGASFPFF